VSRIKDLRVGEERFGHVVPTLGIFFYDEVGSDAAHGVRYTVRKKDERSIARRSVRTSGSGGASFSRRRLSSARSMSNVARA
jgi:hypothetical protein